jgi:histidinol-phosphate phosphatase family protein
VRAHSQPYGPAPVGSRVDVAFEGFPVEEVAVPTLASTYLSSNFDLFFDVRTDDKDLDSPSTAADDRSSSRPRPGVLLDRDGTIIVDHGYVGSVDRVDIIDGAPRAIAQLNQAGVPVAVVTNQSGVARGYYGVEDVASVHHHIAETLASYGAHIDVFLYCPYHPDGVVEAFSRSSESRKPGPGMAHEAAALLNLDLSSSWVVGDRPEDMGLAEAIGASGVYVGKDPCDRKGVWTFPDLATSTPFILERIFS